MNWYSIKELHKMGIKILGNNIKISKKVSIYNPSNIILYDNIRIDDFCLLSAKGKIEIHNFVHIGAFCLLSSSTSIILKDFSGLSSGVKLYGSSDNYNGMFLTNPTVPIEYKNCKNGPIIMEKHSIIGSGSVIMPNILISEGSAIGALSFVNKSTDPWIIYGGNPIRKIKEREMGCLNYENNLVKRYLFLNKLPM